jgi:hypothetical protein
VGQITTITVNDSNATSHDFIPVSKEAGITTFEEKSSTSSKGFWPLTVSLAENATSGVSRFLMRIKVPVVQTETINGVDNPKVVRMAMAEVRLSYDSGSSLAERQDLNAIVQNLLASAAIKDVCENLNNLY